MLTLATVLTILGVCLAGDVEYCRSKDTEHEFETCTVSLGSVPCEGKVKLINLDSLELGEDNIFFVETSEKEVVTPREGCALESSARNSGLSVVMVRAGTHLDLTDNTTCSLYNNFRQVNFLHVELDTIAQNTPIQGFFSSDKLGNSMNRNVHTADALRLLLIDKYGGFYADTDFVILKPLTELRNVIASDQVVEEMHDQEGRLLVGDTVSNAIFHFSKGHKILRLALQQFNQMFQSNVWASGGPNLLQKSLLQLCGFGPEVGVKDIQMTRERFSPDNCGGVQVMDSKSFYPFGWFHQVLLFDPKRSRKDWYEMFRNSLAVHFYHSSSQTTRGPIPIRRPKFYGARKPSYLVLALDNCPVSFWSSQLF